MAHDDGGMGELGAEDTGMDGLTQVESESLSGVRNVPGPVSRDVGTN